MLSLLPSQRYADIFDGPTAVDEYRKLSFQRHFGQRADAFLSDVLFFITLPLRYDIYFRECIEESESGAGTIINSNNIGVAGTRVIYGIFIMIALARSRVSIFSPIFLESRGCR